MAFLYPWGNTQQLNLDWILQKIKELEAEGGADIDEVAEALIAAAYSHQAYDRSDIVFRDGKLYRANQAIPAPGEAWTPAHWDEILLGDTVSNLVQYVAALSNDQIANSSSVSGTHTSDALDTLKNQIEGITLDSDNVSNESLVPGATVSDALDTLNGSITAVENSIAIVSNNNTHVAIAKGQYVYIKNHGTLTEGLYQALSAIPQNDTLSLSNVTDISGGGLNAFVGRKLVPVLDTMFSSTNPTLMEAGHQYPWNSGTLPVENYLGFVWIFYPTSTAITSQKIILDEVGTARSSHYSLATSQNGQVRILHNVLDAYYEFTSSDSTVYLHRIYGIRYEIN